MEREKTSPSNERHHGHEGHHHQHDFKLENLDVHFSACLREDGSLWLDAYIAGYDELNRFLNLLGTVFGWVAADVHAKLEVLSAHRQSDKREQYATIQGMVDYEVKEDMIKPSKAKDANNGSRNLLRLHRALQYIIRFLEWLPDMDFSEKCCHASQAAYKETLMKYHPWVVQKAALMAMHMLPTKEGLIHKICGDSEQELIKAVETLPKAVAAMKAVYDKTQEVYRKYDLLDLP